MQVLRSAQAMFPPSEPGTDTYTAILYRLARAHAGLKQPAEAGHDYLSAYANYELTRADAPGAAGKSDISCTWRTSITSLSEAGQRLAHSIASSFDFTWIIQ